MAVVYLVPLRLVDSAVGIPFRLPEIVCGVDARCVCSVCVFGGENSLMLVFEGIKNEADKRRYARA